MHAAAVRFDLHIPESRSLKVKRAAIRPIVDGEIGVAVDVQVIHPEDEGVLDPGDRG